MDYQKELQRLEEAANYWKPEPGNYKVKALSELQEAEPFVKQKEDGTNEVTEQAKIDLEINGKKTTWTFGIGKTPASTYGQFVEYAVKNNGLLNKEFTIIVKSDGKKNNYTIV